MPHPVSAPGTVTRPTPWAAHSNIKTHFREEILPNIQREPPAVQLKAVSSRPVAGRLGEETNPNLAKTPFRHL